MRQGSILTLSALGEVWELLKTRNKWLLRGAPSGERVAHAGTGIYHGVYGNVSRSLFVLTVGGGLAELACVTKPVKPGKFFDCEWISHGNPGVPISGGLIALGNEGAVFGVGTDGRVHERKQVLAAEYARKCEWKWVSLGAPRGDLPRVAAPLF